MKNKIFIVTFIITIVVVAGIGWIFLQDNSNKANLPNELENNSPILSADQKSIVSADKVLLAIDNDEIYSWFKTESQLCDEYNLDSTPDRKIFCESKQGFGQITKFSSIQVSPDRKQIGFTIVSETLSPDSAVGIYDLDKDSLEIISDYYLGNEFISFSTTGKYFIIKGRCWEAMCGLYVKDSNTLAETVGINDPEYVDYRQADTEFIQWVSDNEVEYEIQSINSDEKTIERKVF